MTMVDQIHKFITSAPHVRFKEIYLTWSQMTRLQLELNPMKKVHDTFKRYYINVGYGAIIIIYHPRKLI